MAESRRHPSPPPACPQRQRAEPWADDVWIVHGKAYDLRSFVDHHPGGAHAISLGRGIDCTELFESYHPFTDVPRKALKLYEVKMPAEAPLGPSGLFDWESTPLYTDIKAAVRRHFSPRGDETDHEVQANSKATWFAWAQHLVGLALTTWAFGQWCRGSLLAVVHFPLLYWVVCSDLMHNGSHFAMSTRPAVNTVCSYIGSLHIQHHLWAIQHVVGHHVHTNMHGLDPDLHHFTHEREEEAMVPGYRSHPKHDYLPKYRRFWKFALWIQSGATTLALALVNVPLYVGERAVLVTKVPERFIASIKFDRALLCLLLGAVLCYHGVAWGTFRLFWSWVVHGLAFNVFSQMSHVNEESMEASEAYLAERKLEKNEWAVHEMLSALDYSCDSFFWRTASSNLNQQMCHHVLPSVHPVHYPALRQLLIPICRQHGVDYEGRSSNTFLGALGKYLRWVHELNERPAGEEWRAARLLGICQSTCWMLLLSGAVCSCMLTLPLLSVDAVAGTVICSVLMVPCWACILHSLSKVGSKDIKPS
mmetsp:Transcript_4341/g.13267  ORF Transcript_4341/g.13267 Transcript_4341/m.13267 type:complete len:533 (-) Transcript_4341:105-1703(-)